MHHCDGKDIEHGRVNVGEEDELMVYGYKTSIWHTVLLVVLTIATGGLLLGYLFVRPAARIRLMMKRCSLDRAQFLVLKDKYGDEFVEPLYQMQQFSHRYFMHKKLKYIWNSEYKHFVKVKGLDSEKCSVIYSQMEGASTSEASLKLKLFGPNSIEIEVLPIWKLIVAEITGPFYLYQFFIIIVWLVQWYYQFAACILVLSTVSVATHVWQTRKQAIALRKKVQSASMVTVIRDSIPVRKSSIELVPGDVIILPQHETTNFSMECDAVLMNGSCIMDESMLTGESLPVPKVPLVDNPTNIYSSAVHKSNTLFSGTKLLNVYTKEDYFVTAVVVRTGFSTAKGELARSILYPMQKNNNIKRQIMKISAIFFFYIGIPSFFYTYYALSRYQFPMFDVLIIVLDVGTFLIPPVLPAVLTSVNVHAQRRLKKEGIFCLNSQAICCAGEIDVMCFDKTGTITEDTIDFTGIVPVSNGRFAAAIPDTKSLPADHMVVMTMATCHSLVKYHGNLEGDDLDLKLFKASQWNFATVDSIDSNLMARFATTPERIVVAPDHKDHLVGILKQYPFESFLQRMMVIVQDVQQGKYYAIAKGAPEVVKTFCMANTLPENFDEILEHYTGKGFRVLAAASKVIPANDVQQLMDMNRNELESGMNFNGFYLFKNKLKPSSLGTLQELSDANIRCVMATGDNILTAINVAQECQMVKKSSAIIRVQTTMDMSTGKPGIRYNYVQYPDFATTTTTINNNNNQDDPESSDIEGKKEQFNYHLAIDGDTFSMVKNTQPDLIEKIVHKGTIFARMTPDQKLSLITILRKQDHSVGMCGDGANDCGALRAADAGISLSVAEASVASPFTYKNKDISCVPALIKEGRCTLVSVFGTYKYQISYCFTLLAAAMILFWHGLKASDGTYVFVDIVMNIFPPIVFATTKPYPKLSKQMPIRNLLSLVPQLSINLFLIIQVGVYALATVLLKQQPWYRHVENKDINVPMPNQLAYAIFACNTMSYVIAAIVFAPGPPFRKGFFSNKIYILMVLINFSISFTMSIVAPSFLINYLEFIPLPLEFRLKLLLISFVNFLLALCLEKYILYRLIANHVLPYFREKFKTKSRKKFRILEEQIGRENWPFENLIGPFKVADSNGDDRLTKTKSSSIHF